MEGNAKVGTCFLAAQQFLNTTMSVSSHLILELILQFTLYPRHTALQTSFAHSRCLWTVCPGFIRILAMKNRLGIIDLKIDSRNWRGLESMSYLSSVVPWMGSMSTLTSSSSSSSTTEKNGIWGHILCIYNHLPPPSLLKFNCSPSANFFNSQWEINTLAIAYWRRLLLLLPALLNLFPEPNLKSRKY